MSSSLLAVKNQKSKKKIKFLHLVYFGLLLCLVLCLLFMGTLLETCPMAENNLRNLYEIYLVLGHEIGRASCRERVCLYV